MSEREMIGYNLYCESCHTMLSGPAMLAVVVDGSYRKRLELLRDGVSPDEMMLGPQTVAECNTFNVHDRGPACPACKRAMFALPVMKTRYGV